MKILKIYGYAFLAIFIFCTFVFIPPFFLQGQDQDIPVYSKTTAREIAKSLQEKGIIHFSTPFLVLTKLTHADRKLKAGLYRLNPRMSLWGVMTTLSEGKSELMALKVPEGYTTDQIAQELERLKVISAADFMKIAQDPILLKNLGIKGPSVEGFLFPQTYRVPISANGEALVNLMVRQFYNTVGNDFESRCSQRGLTPYQAVILASIVEKEAQRAEERPIIAGVMYNRLHKKIRLEVNATLNYVLATKRAWLTNAQLNTQSPYNTYQHRGLPPTPICNPGLASIQAVLDPAD
ncbi:MAG TPA: endolytic transglycosylase MltG, partial [bacterium]|nr:endolytic transglycosylase MltG [bacterium]